MTVYMDAAATTAVSRDVAELVLRLMVEDFGNAGSRTHDFGGRAKKAVNNARAQVAAVVDSDPEGVLFTSGATESNNLAILGLAPYGRSTDRRHIVSTAIEHKAVLEPLQRLVSEGFEVEFVRPGPHGRVEAEDVLRQVRPDTLLVSVMSANNETGVIQPVTEIAAGLGNAQTFLHVDAAQAFGKDIESLSDRRIDLISVSGHKLFAPKGVGALVTKRRGFRRLPLTPLMVGGGQERGLRPGTVAVPLVAGLGLAAASAVKHHSERRHACMALREMVLQHLAGIGAVVHGDGPVLPHILSFHVPGVDSEALMVLWKEDVAVSNGSACTSASYTPSHVLEAMGLTPEAIAGTVRFSWSHETPVPNLDALTRQLAAAR
jgi:cysteine desulfurase